MGLYAVYRSDLKMDPHKMAAQTGHAYELAMCEARLKNPHIDKIYKGTGNGTKLLMRVKNEYQLERAYFEILELGIPCVMVIDRGHVIEGTPFNGKPIVTAIGFGPCLRKDVDHITKRMTMLPMQVGGA